MIRHGDSLEVLKEFPDNYFDSVVTDPPYGLKFMGKKWDYDVPSVDLWKEILRVLKPGGHVLSFGGTRTYHRMVVNMEDAGFEIRDQIMWIYGQGFPKSLNISKAIDKNAGETRKTEYKPNFKNNNFGAGAGAGAGGGEWNAPCEPPKTDQAIQWDGWGTQLKPANEPIVLARKPISEKTIQANVLKWGTGGLNIDGSRIETSDILTGSGSACLKFGGDNSRPYQKDFKSLGCNQNPQGRFPANIIFDEDAAAMLDGQTGELKGPWGKDSKQHVGKNGESSMFKIGGVNSQNESRGQESGGASRFFYIAKTSTRERGEGNNHPTVKPVKLMEYLCKLVTPPTGIILDPFMGSGSTGIAAKNLEMGFVGIELNPEYAEIARKRIGEE